jgi:hypothetical protein
MRAEVEDLLIGSDGGAGLAEIVAQPVELCLTHLLETDLVEEAQQPGLTGREDIVLQELVPDRQGSADELVGARAVHPVDAHIDAADAHCALEHH